MWLKAWLACSKLALFPLSSTAGRTADSEYLFGVKFLFHGLEIMHQTEVWRMVNFEQLPKMLLLDFKLGHYRSLANPKIISPATSSKCCQDAAPLVAF